MPEDYVQVNLIDGDGHVVAASTPEGVDEIRAEAGFPPDEAVLCVPAHLLDGVSGYVKGDRLGPLLHIILDPANQVYVDREAAEQDPSLLQLIPYAVIKRGNEVFAYQRTDKSGEPRLVGGWSVGVGGHVNPVDGHGHGSYDAAFARELAEEVGLVLAEERSSSAPIVGLILDLSGEAAEGRVPVGHVHLGLVHSVRVPFATPLHFTDPALAHGRFEHVIDLRQRAGDFEAWSRMVLENL